MIVWLNGAFGAGKTTVSRSLVAALPAARRWDPERIGYVLRLVRRSPTGDFQDLPSWRRWAVRVGRWHARGGRTVVAVQSVLEPAYRAEIFGGLRSAGVPVRQVVLRVPEPVLRARIDADAVDRRARALAALDGLAAREPDTIEVDNTSPPSAVAAEIVRRLTPPP